MKKLLALMASTLIGASSFFVPAGVVRAAVASAYGVTQRAFGTVINANGTYTYSVSADGNASLGVPSGKLEIYRKDRQTGVIDLVSASSSGGVANDNAYAINASDDGRYVLFWSAATNLVPGGTSRPQLYVKDLNSGAITVASATSDGVISNAGEAFGQLSGNGQFVVFSSDSTNLVPNDTNGRSDVFEKNLQTGELKLLSVKPDGQLGDGYSLYPSVNFDGRYVAFESFSSNLAPQTGGMYSIYVADTVQGTLRNIIHTYDGSSIRSNNTHDPGSSLDAFISGDGTKVVFSSFAANLVADDTNQSKDTFLWDAATNSISRISLKSDGTQLNYNPVGDNFSLAPVAFSEDGTHVLFTGVGRGNQIVSGLTDNKSGQLYLRDLATGAYQIISAAPDGSFGTIPIFGQQCSANATSASLTADASLTLFGGCNNLDPNSSGSFSSNAYIHFNSAQPSAVPHIVGTADRQPNEYGWYNADVTINWTLVDPTGQFGPIDGGNRTLVSGGGRSTLITSGQSCNAAGDCISGHYYLSIDKDAPVVTGPIQGSGLGQGGGVSVALPVVEANGAFNLDQSQIPFGDDYISQAHMSGEYFIDIDPGQGNGVPMIYYGDMLRTRTSFADPGLGHVIGVRARDKAGNWTPVVYYSGDTVPPVIIGMPNNDGWYNHDVTVHWTATDPAPSSGAPTQPADTVVSTEGANQVITSGQSCDPAGNCATGQVTLSIDETAPSVGAVGNLSKNVLDPLALSVAADDQPAGVGSGVVGGEYFVGADPGEGLGAAMTYAGGSLGLATGDATLVNLPAGLYQVGVRSRDAAGNWSSTATGQLTVILPAPTGLSATSPTTNAPMLTWNAVPTATQYQVYRSTTSGVLGSAIGQPVTAPSFTDTYAPGVYYYSVVAMNATGVPSASSAQVQVAVVNPVSAHANEALAQSQTQVRPVYGTGPGADLLPGLVQAGQTNTVGFDFDLGYIGTNNAFNVKRNFQLMYDTATSHFLVTATAIDPWLAVNSTGTHATFQGMADVTVGTAAPVSRPFAVDVDAGADGVGNTTTGQFGLVVYADESRSTVLYRVNDPLGKGRIDVR